MTPGETMSIRCPRCNRWLAVPAVTQVRHVAAQRAGLFVRVVEGAGRLHHRDGAGDVTRDVSVLEVFRVQPGQLHTSHERPIRCSHARHFRRIGGGREEYGLRTGGNPR